MEFDYFEKKSKDYSPKPLLIGDVFIFAKVEIFPKEFCVFGSVLNNSLNKSKEHGTKQQAG